MSYFLFKRMSTECVLTLLKATVAFATTFLAYTKLQFLFMYFNFLLAKYEYLRGKLQ